MQNSLSKVQKTDPLCYTDLLLDLNCRSSFTQRRTAVNRQQTTVRKAHNRQQPTNQPRAEEEEEQQERKKSASWELTQEEEMAQVTHGSRGELVL